MTIFSFNVNGIRAAINKGFYEWFDTIKPDVLCLQEIKASPDQFDTEFFDKRGYKHYWFPAEKKGYSGVALISKIKPDFLEKGIRMPVYDSEGRIIRADFGDITIICAYFPSGTSGDDRQAVKMKFLTDIQQYLLNLKKIRPNLIISGDYNIAHKEIDINHPKKHVKMSGFLPEERAWFDQFLAKGFIDSFREFNHQSEQYSWWTYRASAREKNLGWRIDYHIVSEPLKNRLKGAAIHSDIFQSDHCPVSVEIGL
jgi:exodeoxyribonuclease-3